MKKIGFVLILTGFLIFSGITHADLVAYYSFDGNTYDLSGNGHDGTAYGGLSYEDGILGQAASFDGLNDYISIAHHDDFDMPNGMSISLWLYSEDFTDPGYGKRIISKRQNYGTSPGWILQTYSDGTVRYQGYLGGGINTNIATPSTSLYNWYHVVATYDNTTASMYLNGELVDQHEYIGTITTNDSPVIIGQVQNFLWSNEYFDGLIDELRIYDQALTSEEISQLYKPVPEPATIFILGTGLVSLAGLRRKLKKAN